MSTASRAPAPRTDPEVRRRQFIDAAVEAFARDGYPAVELRDVAARVGVTRNLVHRYFPGGKRDLYLEAVREACGSLAALLDVDPGVELRDKTPANIARYLDEILAPSTVYTLYARALRSADDEVRALALTTREAIARGIASNHLGTGDPPAPLLAALVGYISFAETTCEQWPMRGRAGRAALERLLAEALVAIVAAAR